MNNYFSEFVKKHGGDNVFSEKIGISRQAVGNIKRGANRATEKVIVAIEANYNDFDRTMYLSEGGLKEYLDKIQILETKNQELKMKVKLLEENQKMWIGAIMQGSSLGKHEVYTSNQSGMSAMPYNISEFDKLDKEASVAFIAQSLFSDIIGEA